MSGLPTTASATAAEQQAKNEVKPKKVDWGEISSDEEDEDEQRRAQAKAKKKAQSKTATSTKTKGKGIRQDSQLANNIFLLQDSDDGDFSDEDEKARKKEKDSGPSLKDFIKSNQTEVKDKAAAPLISKKEQKKKEMEEFDKILSEYAQANNTATPATTEGTSTEVKQPEDTKTNEADAEAKKKKKKNKNKKKDAPEDATAAATTTTATSQEEQKEGEIPAQKEAAPQTPADVEAKIQELMKKKAAAAKKQADSKKGPNLDSVKQQILQRQQNAKKSDKKKFEES